MRVFHRSSFLTALTLAACASPAPSTPAAEEPQAAAAYSAPKIVTTGPIHLVDAPTRLRAQKLLDTLPNVQRLRIDSHGDVRTLALYGDILSLAAPVDMALDALALYSEALGFEGVDRAGIAAQMTLERVLTDDTAMHVRLQQVHAGITMDDRSIDVHIALGSPARLLAITGAAALPANIDAPEAAVKDSDALTAAAKTLASDVKPTFIRSLRYIDVDGKSKLAWRVEVRADGISDTLYFSANDATFLRKDERIKHGAARGFTFAQNRVATPRSWMPLANLAVTSGSVSETTGADGNFSFVGAITFALKGPYADVQNEKAVRYSYAGDAIADVQFSEGDTHEAELSAFLHTNMAHDYLKAQFGYTGMDRLVPVHVHSNVCNAYADPEKGDLHFGECGTAGRSDYWDLALSADVNIHEYMHLVADEIIALQFSCSDESGAYGEGMSDYFACAVTEDASIGEDSNGTLLRKCDNTLQYQKDYDGECHSGAFLFSGSMWDFRKAQGKAIADTLAFWSMHYTPKKPTLIDVRDAVVAADRARNGGIHEQAIITAFAGHGVSDQLALFVTTDNPSPLMRPFDATVVAHAQGFDRASVKYHWTFDDGSVADGDEVSHTFKQKAGSAKVTVTDKFGTTKSGEIAFASSCRQGGSPAWFVLALCGLMLARRRKR